MSVDKFGSSLRNSSSEIGVFNENASSSLKWRLGSINSDLQEKYHSSSSQIQNIDSSVREVRTHLKNLEFEDKRRFESLTSQIEQIHSTYRILEEKFEKPFKELQQYFDSSRPVTDGIHASIRKVEQDFLGFSGVTERRVNSVSNRIEKLESSVEGITNQIKELNSHQSHLSSITHSVAQQIELLKEEVQRHKKNLTGHIASARAFEEDFRDSLKVKLLCLKDLNSMKANLIFTGYFNLKGGKTEMKYFKSQYEIILVSNDLNKWYEENVYDLIDQMVEFEGVGSGWSLEGIISLKVIIAKSDLLNGASYIKLPKFISDKKAVINIECSELENDCFAVCIMAHLFPLKKGSPRQNKHNSYIAYERSGVEFGEINFPVRLIDIPRFEALNGNISLNNIYEEDDGDREDNDKLHKEVIDSEDPDLKKSKRFNFKKSKLIENTFQRHIPYSVGLYYHDRYEEEKSYYTSFRGRDCTMSFAQELRKIAERVHYRFSLSSIQITTMFADINEVTPYPETRKVSELEVDHPYRVKGGNLIKTKFGMKIVLELKGDDGKEFTIYIPKGLNDVMLKNSNHWKKKTPPKKISKKIAKNKFIDLEAKEAEKDESEVEKDDSGSDLELSD
ncbi:hypothetical protein QAD02_002559 [Eretmocerus hayati]|uniref:Uncharacterized protein n=1 Tax=Eretmocerus hayati TaxID=131215 RepID=A0ACC2NJE3_9HYME|nr:hypothetical protein QAD02_002559 [Eretmocerus hayati]